LDCVHPLQVGDLFAACLVVLEVLAGDRTYMRQNPKGEPQLGKRGLYHAIGGLAQASANEMEMLWLLNLSDGEHSLLDTAERSGCDFAIIRNAAAILCEFGLLKEVSM